VTPAGSAAAAAAVANQAPVQIAAALHAQGKTYEDLVHMYADMVSYFPLRLIRPQYVLDAAVQCCT
jgi:hypothetical protein